MARFLPIYTRNTFLCLVSHSGQKWNMVQELPVSAKLLFIFTPNTQRTLREFGSLSSVTQIRNNLLVSRSGTVFLRGIPKWDSWNSPRIFCHLSRLLHSSSAHELEMLRTHRNIIHRAEQQISVWVTVDLGLSLKHHSLIVQRLDNFWLLLRGEKRKQIHAGLSTSTGLFINCHSAAFDLH